MNAKYLMILYLISVLVGAGVAIGSRAAGDAVAGLAMESPSFQAATMAGSTGPWQLALVIFGNNLLIAAVAGTALIYTDRRIAFLILMYLAGTNGFLLGLFGAYSAVYVSPLFALAAIAPHGILEIPAVIYSWVLGTRGINAVSSIGDFYKKTAFYENLRKTLIYIVPVLAVAAVVETFVTPITIGMV